MKPVISENVASYEHESGTLTLRVQFLSGSIYEYFGVPSDLAAEFDAPHPWHRVRSHLNTYPYRRIT
jgi:hypothetical protein